MRMGFRLSLAVVVAAALFAVAWAVGNQLAGLGVGASSAAAGVLAIVAFGLTWRVTRPERPPERHLRSAHAEPDGLSWRAGTRMHGGFAEPAARSGEPGRELPEKPGITGTSTPRARDIPAQARARTLVTQHIRFIVDDAGMQVRRKRKTVGGEVWEEHLRIPWSAVTAMGFATGRYDPIVALYAWGAVGKPHHVADSRFLNQVQWTQLGELIAEATRGRLILDVAGRDDPRSIRPDW
jgi:hypothetical protein